MMMRLLTAAAFLTIGAQAARAETVVLTPGQEITLQIRPDGRVKAGPARPSSSMSPLEQRAFAAAVGTPVPEGATTLPPEGLQRKAGEPEQAIPAQRLRITFRRLAGKSAHDSTLLIENGYDLQFRYKAAITVQGKRAFTDVCTVRPNIIGLEHWPYPIEQIEISQPTLEQPPEDGGVTCE